MGKSNLYTVILATRMAMAKNLGWNERHWAERVIDLESEIQRLNAIISKKSYDYGALVEACNEGNIVKAQSLIESQARRRKQ